MGENCFPHVFKNNNNIIPKIELMLLQTQSASNPYNPGGELTPTRIQPLIPQL